jgi:hypothetical protein
MQNDDLEAPTEAELQDAVSERLIAVGDTLPPPLRDEPLDVIAGLMKLAASVVGGGSGAFGDFFAGKLFPKTLQDRVRTVLAAVIRRLEAHNRRLRRLEHRIDDLGAQHIALLQEGLESAARATSDERIELIGAIVGDGLSADELQAEFERSHLRLLNALTDRDVEALCGMVHPKYHARSGLLGPDHVREQTLQRAINVMAQTHLLSLGLIEEQVSLELRPTLGGGAPRTNLKRHPKTVTPLGRSLVIRLDEAAAPVPGPADELAPVEAAPETKSGAVTKSKGEAGTKRRV